MNQQHHSTFALRADPKSTSVLQLESPLTQLNNCKESRNLNCSFELYELWVMQMQPNLLAVVTKRDRLDGTVLCEAGAAFIGVQLFS
jgi:hypothetical protein